MDGSSFSSRDGSTEVDESRSAGLDSSTPSPDDMSREVLRDARACAWCRTILTPGLRRDALYCTKRCRQAAHRFGRVIAVAESAAVPKRLAYADPPYVGLSRRYYKDHPDFRGEVDHADLVSRLQDYDGWALSLSERSLPYVLSLFAGDDTIRVAAWFRGHRGQRACGPRSSWEPVIYRCARPEVSSTPGDDALVYPARARLTDPDRVIGAKSPTFASWMFGLIGARRGDSLDDIFPGSGGISRAWSIYVEAPKGCSPQKVR